LQGDGKYENNRFGLGWSQGIYTFRVRFKLGQVPRQGFEFHIVKI